MLTEIEKQKQYEHNYIRYNSFFYYQQNVLKDFSSKCVPFCRNKLREMTHFKYFFFRTPIRNITHCL